MKPRLLVSFLCLLLLLLNNACQPSDSQPSIRQLDDARQARIGVMTGSTGEAITKTRFPAATVKSFDDVMDAIAALKSGQLDAIVTGYPSAIQTAKKNPELTVLEEPLDHEDTAIALRKDNPQLLVELDQLISRWQQDGTLVDMKRRWLKNDLSPYQVPAIPLPTAGQPLRVGVSATREPFSFVDESGQVSGHDGELARRIAAALHRPLLFSDMKFMALIPALQSGKVDLIVTGMTATEERKKFVNFTHPYFANAQVMMVRQTHRTTTSSTATGSDIKSLDDLADQRIAVLSGSAGDLAARQHFKNAQFQAMEAASDAALAISSHKSDAFIYDKSVLLNLAAKNPQLRILEPALTQLEVAAAIKLDNTAMLQAINQALQTLENNGRLQQLRQKWLTPYTSAPPALDLPSTETTDGILRLGTCATLEPFSFLLNGHFAGLDIELAHWIAHVLHKRLDIVDMQFEALIPALQAGKIDFALSNFNVTAERQKLVAFSQAYSQNDIAALVRQSTAKPALPTLADLADKRLGVLLGSAHDRYASAHFPKATLLQYQAPADVALAVKTGKVDAALFDAEPLKEIMHDDPSFAIVGEPLFWSDVAMGFRQDNLVLKQQFDRFLAEIRGNGIYADMVKRWMQDRLTTTPQLPANPATAILNVGTSNTGFPFTLVKDNQLIGFDIELAQRFGLYIGKQVQFSNMEFGGLITAVASGKIDMIASSLYITDERKQQIRFSEPYYPMATQMFVLKQAPEHIDQAASGQSLTKLWTSIVNSFDSNILQENRYLLLWDGLKTTVVISICATLLGTLLGALICSMRLSSKPLLRGPAKLYITLIRGTPVLVLLMLTFYVVFASVNINPVLVAVIAFAMNFAAYVSEIFRTGIESIDRGQVEAGIAMGFSRFKTFIYIELPQTLQRILPVYKGEFISLVKMTSIVGYIAVQDLTKASDIIRSRTFDAFFPLIMVAILYFLISWTLMQALEYLERVTDPKYRRKQRSKKA